MASIFKQIEIAARSNQKVALCTIVSSKGSSPRKAGAKMLVWSDGRIAKTIGGGDLEKKVTENAIEVIKNGKAQLFEHKLNYDHGMCCGGVVQIFIEPIMNIRKMYIFGAGHTGKALARMSAMLDFEVTVIDNRDDIVDDLALPSEITVMEEDHHKAMKKLTFDENTYVVVVTHNHNFDKEIIAFCAKQKFAYLGMIGSRRKVEMAKKGYIVGEVLTQEEMDIIDWPIGLNINAITPEEIAVAILGKIVEVKNKTLNEN